MENLHSAIVSNDMVWLWYYDEFGGKHIRELLEKDARDYIENRKILTPAPPVEIETTLGSAGSNQ
ncbi:hypothetical protein [Dyadobacter sp. CY323]|uniref:hypothetical protein n=1 Tax=Dyadobacter sp. CY323 TaxID=2907302 RepID=UPI001F3DC803|nr:hypothetical protein [Dyadobacter sp. CY323]MCE6987806.1 hypothetical protein [Dyadobacter sp. CY323]